MHLDRTDPHLAAAREHAELSTDLHLRAHRRASDDGAAAFDHEGAIEREAKKSGGAARLESVELARNLGAQIVKSRAGG